MTPELLQAATGCQTREATVFAPAIEAAWSKWGIVQPEHHAAFLAQTAHESRLFTWLVESLNYSAERLMEVWPHRFPTYGDAATYARKPEAIANLVYADRMGNGPVNSGDGWRYRGRGIIMLTGADAYRRCGAALGVDLVASPERMLEPEVAASAAGWYWITHGCGEAIDDGDFAMCTKKINGGLTGLDERVKLWNRAKAVMGIA